MFFMLTPLIKLFQTGNNILFYNIKISENIYIPFLIGWLAATSMFFMIKLKFFNIKNLIKSFMLCFNKKLPHNQLELSPRKIVLTAIGSSVDLGSVFGVALGVVIGGPGVIFWLIVAGIFGTSIRFIEVFASHKYRNHLNKTSFGGPHLYIERIFSELNLHKTGKVIAFIFALFFTFSTFCSLQVNQTVSVITEHSFQLQNYRFLTCIIFASIIIISINTGMAKITKIAEKIVPWMTICYFICTAIVLIFHYDKILSSIFLILKDALSFNNVKGNTLGCFVIGMQRAFFCNEAGMGTGAIVHASSDNKNTLLEATISMVTPVISVLVVCLCSGVVVVISGAYNHNLNDGIKIIIQAFESVHPLLRFVIFLVVPVFGYTTAISWGYCGNRTWCYLFGEKSSKIYYIVLFVSYIVCGMVKDFGFMLDIADLMNLSITIPNILALMFFVSKKDILKKS